MAYITKDQLNLYLQKVNGQSAAAGQGGVGATGTARSRSTLNGPRPPNFGSKVSSRKIFQDGGGASSYSPSIIPSTPLTPTTTTTHHIESAVKNLGLSSAPSPPSNHSARAASPILESMGESGPPPTPVIMESMGSDDYGPPVNPMQQYGGGGGMPNGHYGTVSGFMGGGGGNGQTWPHNGYGPLPQPQHHTIGYGSQTIGPGQYYPNGNHSHNNNYYDPNLQQLQQHQPQSQHPVHLSQEQYLQLQQQQYQQQQQQQQQQEYLRQKNSQNAAAHGYLPSTPTASGHMVSPGVTSVLAHPVPTPATVSKTITPRIVPIVEIPKYTTINPPKTEIETLNDEQDDDDWAPEPPPRDPPKNSTIAAVAAAVNKPMPKPPSRPHTPIDTAFLPDRPPTPKISIPPKLVTSETYPTSASSGGADSPRSKLSSHSNTPVVAETPIFAQEVSQEDRVPMPPPREFRRKSTASPTIANTPMSSSANRSTTNGIFSLGPSISTTPVKSTSSSIFAHPDSSSSATSSGFRVKGTTPTPGTVRANSAKFNALAASGTVNTNPKTVPSKSNSSTIGSSDATATATSNPWTSRKAVENLRRNSLSKGTGSSAPKTRKSLDLPASSSSSISSDSTSPKSQSVVIPPEVYADKELPPIRAATPQSRPTTPRAQELLHANIPYDVDSKCILTEEDKLVMIPMADDESKEILVEQEEPKLAPKPATPPTKPARSGGEHTGGSNLFVCASCDEPISGTMITAMGKRWHSDHFVCIVCDLNLEHVQFFHKDGEPYCHFDYHDKFSPKCGHCNTPIENECLTALGKSWHPGHFFCRECGDPFEEDGYMVHDGFPYCEKDYLRLFAPKCTGCQDAIQGDFISALKGKWHRDCFGCTVCHIGFDSSSYYVENGKPYCKAHYKNGSRATTTTVTPTA
ncbi:hypothetical protein BGZ95_010142 [Linnemannia exigua]|uniref:LIM zinc-binding domain-containing protein n=1 Tax=Linnemannia exigua TaxID=604196 RepID=A0AAD4DBU7_9FUNG|nr:hypothetical protein BGZ95_010142 [Linnemannia exigua]